MAPIGSCSLMANARESAQGPFVSDLSVSELLLAEASGFRPRGLVFGCSIFHAGTRPYRPTRSCEVGPLSSGLYEARHDALSRMSDEALALGADGVIGVRLTLSTGTWSDKSVEFNAVGTAVEATDGWDWSASDGVPFTSDLSGREFFTLLRSGYRPLGFVMGTCVYHVGRRRIPVVARQAGRNVELEVQTQALYSARELAMTRMQDEAAALGAAGVVGSRITESTHVWRRSFIEFLAFGTAIEPLEGRSEPLDLEVALSMDR
jgi:uncharacterized protein YbjQ (UPF0145 family)